MGSGTDRLLALLSEKTILQAACSCGLSERTLRRWLSSDEAFKAEYAAARRATFYTAMSRIAGLSARAVDTLEELLGEARHPAVRLGAARSLIEIGIHQHDAETILAKLNDIEAARNREETRR